MDAYQPRPAVHFTPESGWMNDPLAVTWHRGRYHLFFQHVPGRMTWAPQCNWGHASSPDLLTWTEHPVVLAPGDGDDGVWSGSMAVAADGRATIFYTSVSVPDFGVGRIRTATPVDDDWMVWEKGEFVVEPPAENLVAFRDPFVMCDGNGWRMLVGTAITGGVAAAASYSSPDLVTWSYEGLAAQRHTTDTDPVWTGALWECPQVFHIGERDVLVTSVWQDDELHHVVYGIGEFRDGRFFGEQWGQLTHGAGYYAPSFFRDEAGRPCLIFWLRGARNEQAGWASALSVPHVLSIRGNELVSQPYPALGEATAVPISGPLQSPTLFLWSAEQGDRLHLSSAGEIVVALTRLGTNVIITVGSDRILVPLVSPRVQILVDRQTLEIFTDCGVAAVGSADPLEEIRVIRSEACESSSS